MQKACVVVTGSQFFQVVGLRGVWNKDARVSMTKVGDALKVEAGEEKIFVATVSIGPTEESRTVVLETNDRAKAWFEALVGLPGVKVLVGWEATAQARY